MPFNGTGVYSAPVSAVHPAVYGTPINEIDFNALVADLSAALSNCLTADAQSVITFNFSVNNHKITDVAPGTARTDAATIANVRDSNGDMVWEFWRFGECAHPHPLPAIPAYVTGQVFSFRAAAANTGAATVAVSGLATKAIQRFGAALTGLEILSGQWYELLYDGIAFQLRFIVLDSIAGLMPKSGGDFTGAVGFIDGTRSAPGSHPVSSTTTGWYSADDNSFRISTNDVEALCAILGRVSIGPIDPAARFHIKQETDASTGGLMLERTATSARWDVYIDSNGFLVLNGGGSGLGYLIFTGSALLLNGVPLPTAAALIASYESSAQAIVTGGPITLGHLMGVAPKIVSYSLTCVNAEGNYSPGDVLMSGFTVQPTTLALGVSIIGDATNLYIRYGLNAQVFFGQDKTTGNLFALTNGNWTATFRAFA